GTQKLASEASRRFERGVDPNVCRQAAQRVAELLVEHGGGTIDPGVTVVGQPREPDLITISSGLAAAVTGTAISADSTAGALRGVGCAVQRHGDELTVTPPSWRPDLTDPHDLV